MKAKHSIFVLCLVTLLVTNTLAQQPSFTNQYSRIFNGFENSLASVNDVNGALGLQVVIGTIESGNMEIPITLNYSGQGVRASVPHSEVGYGWSLSYGGTINRQVNGIPDETNATG